MQIFLKKITLTGQEVPIRNELKLQFIKSLPPVFMVGSQSMKLLDQFKKDNPEKMDEIFPAKKKTLKTSLAKTVITIEDGRQNHYISWKMYKYNKLILEKLKNSSSEELQQIFNEYLIK